MEKVSQCLDFKGVGSGFKWMKGIPGAGTAGVRPGRGDLKGTHE